MQANKYMRTRIANLHVTICAKIVKTLLTRAEHTNGLHYQTS